MNFAESITCRTEKKEDESAFGSSSFFIIKNLFVKEILDASELQAFPET